MNCNHLSPLSNADKKAMDALGRDIAAISSSRTTSAITTGPYSVKRRGDWFVPSDSSVVFGELARVELSEQVVCDLVRCLNAAYAAGFADAVAQHTSTATTQVDGISDNGDSPCDSNADRTTPGTGRCLVPGDFSSSRTDALGGTEAPLVSLGQGDTATKYNRCLGGCGGLTSSPDHWCVKCSLDNPNSPARVASRAADAQRRTATKPTPATAWDLAVRSIPRDETIDHEVEISLEYKYDPGDRRTRDYPGEPSHVTAVSAFLPPAYCRAILRNLAHELATTSMRIRTDGGTTRGMLTEDAIHDFVQLAGEKVLNVYEAVQDVADDTAR